MSEIAAGIKQQASSDKGQIEDKNMSLAQSILGIATWQDRKWLPSPLSNLEGRGLRHSAFMPRLSLLIASTKIDTDENDRDQTTTELDSHVNMVVVGEECVIFDKTNYTCTVHAFLILVGRLDKVPVDDVVIA